MKQRNSLREHLSRLTVSQQRAYAAECGTSLNYLRKLVSLRGKQRVDVALVALLVAKSRGAVTFDFLRPDVDWNLVRNQLIRHYRRSGERRPIAADHLPVEVVVEEEPEELPESNSSATSAAVEMEGMAP